MLSGTSSSCSRLNCSIASFLLIGIGRYLLNYFFISKNSSSSRSSGSDSLFYCSTAIDS